MKDVFMFENGKGDHDRGLEVLSGCFEMPDGREFQIMNDDIDIVCYAEWLREDDGKLYGHVPAQFTHDDGYVTGIKFLEGKNEELQKVIFDIVSFMLKT